MKNYKFIKIGQVDDEVFNKRPVYTIFNKKSGEEIGHLTWYAAWRQYVFSSWEGIVFNNGCLKDILDFMDNHTQKGGDRKRAGSTEKSN